jgi:protein BCP1
MSPIINSVAVLKEIIKYVLEKSQAHNSAASHQALSTLLLSKPHSVGLLINERILNLAPQVVPVIHNQLVMLLSDE